MSDEVQTDVESPQAPEAASYKTQHAKVLRFEISVGNDDDEKTLEQFEADLRETLAFARDHGVSVFTDARRNLNFHNLTMQGGYYIIDGKVCLSKDYDPATKNRKPGTYPPPWAGGPDPKAKDPLATALAAKDLDDDDEPAAAPSPMSVRDIFPDGYKKPERNEFGRRVRSDKGVKRGPRTKPDISQAADDVLQKIKDSGAVKKTPDRMDTMKEAASG